MSKNNILVTNSSPSASSTSINSVILSDSELNNSIENNNKDFGNKSKTIPRPVSASSTRPIKASRVRFFHNGNKFFNGVVLPVTPERYRSFDSLITDLNKVLAKSVTLPDGVRCIYALDGKKICDVQDLEDGKDYVVSGKSEAFKNIEYSKTDTLKSNKKRMLMGCNKNSPVQIAINNLPKVVAPDCVWPRIVTIIRNGIKPRKTFRILLNKRNSTHMDQILSALSELTQLAVRKVFTQSGNNVTDLSQFFSHSDDVFFVFGNEKAADGDFELDFEESKMIQQYKKATVQRNGGGPKPRMPKKSVKYETAGTIKVEMEKDDESLLEKLCRDNSLLPKSLNDKYIVGKMIGDGNFAIVRRCRDLITNIKYALKIIDKSKCTGKEDMIENEIKILRKVSHPNIMSLIDEYDTKDVLYLICEYVPGGDLFDAISVERKFNEQQSALMVRHLVSALAYLHSMDIVHRDVKPENLLVEMDSHGTVCTLKLGDFGLACEVQRPLYTVCGTPTYVAPEILTETGYGVKIDVWAAGVILYILLCGYPPFVSQDNDQEKLFDHILSGQYDFPDKYWSDVSLLAKELIQNMLQLDPDVRFSAEDVLDHPWLS